MSQRGRGSLLESWIDSCLVAVALAFVLCLAGCGASVAGADGGVGGSGGAPSGTGGAGGVTSGTGGANGDASAPDGALSACQEAEAVGRACRFPADCVAMEHVIDCCGTRVVMGLSAVEGVRFSNLEAACAQSYPACGCAARQTTTDDGSIVAFQDADATCVAGRCVSFAQACGQPCPAGTVCKTGPGAAGCGVP